MSETEKYIEVVLALTEFDVDLDALEGLLLVTGGSDELISPAVLARETDIPGTVAEDIMLQLRRIDAVSASPGEASVYAVNSDIVRDLFSSVREASEIIEGYRQRQPLRTEIEPLVTLPKDPGFQRIVPENLRMNWLMPTLVRMIKRARHRIVILTPFFESTGLDRLESPLLDALAEGVEITIVTRYLHDEESVNRAVLVDMCEEARNRGLDLDGLDLVDYTVWDGDVPEADRRQEGATPAYTLHAKLMVIDEREAYVGSANVTDYGFARYLELGVRLSGPAVESFSILCDHLVSSDGASYWQPP